MKYIRIKNNGLIEPQALHLVGASTKRNDKTKIGQFGSGNKYALAYFLRNGYDLKIFAGKEEVTVETKTESFREITFDVIHINGVRTSITTEMGKDWQFWQAIRELYCNALDEGGCMMDFVQEFEPEEGKTHFYINTKKDVTEFVSNFDNYFATNKKVLFECEYGRILEKTGTKANVYRKGIRCYNTDKTSTYDYDITNIQVDENRLIKYFWEVEEKIWGLIYRCTNKEVIMQILHNSHNSEYLEGCISDISTIGTGSMSEEFKECLRTINTAPKGMAGLLAPDEVNNFVILPTKIFQSVRGVIGDDNVGKKFKISKGGTLYKTYTIDNEMYNSTIKKALDFFKECGFDIPYEIEIAVFDHKDILGLANEGKIILSEICLERGVKEVVSTIIEEYVHLKHEVKDETRAFQNAMITEMVSYMEKKNAYLI